MVYPVYQFMDSFPHQMNQMPSTLHHYHHHPRFEATPGQMKADFERCPSYYQSWPAGGSYPYPPTQCHGCCDHNYFPGFCSQRPPCAYAPPPYYHSSCPVPPGPYPVQYIPPPNYTMEPPRHKYHNEMPGYGHCCGCANQTCSWKPGKNVKIEEEDPDSEKKANDSLVPFDLKSYPYQVVWIPPGYMMNKASNKSSEFQPMEKEKYSDAAKAQEASKLTEQQQNILNGYFPSTVENSGLSKQGGDSARQHQHPDEGKRQFSFPIFWMPWNPDQMKITDTAKANSGEESIQGKPSRFEVTPVIMPDAEQKTSEANANEEPNSLECVKTVEKNSVQKTVPVKSAEPTEEKKTSENNEDKVESLSAENVKSDEERKSSQTSGKSKSSSPLKSSKLPPVCLRVDSLRKKRNPNGNSRSPTPPDDKGKLRESSKDSAQPPTSSTTKEIAENNLTVGDNGSPTPPGDKGKLHQSSKDSAQPPISSTTKEIAEKDLTVGDNVPEKTKDVEQIKRKVKTIQVTDGTSKQEGTQNVNIAHPYESNMPVSSHDVDSVHETNYRCEEVSPDLDASEVNFTSSAAGKIDEEAEEADQGKTNDSGYQMEEDKGNFEGQESPGDKTKEFGKIELSEAEAAVIIQSAYRGYEVRRWEPLKKLKQIANISEEVVKLNNRIRALESYPDTQDNDKWRTILGENIMNLLLKLDAIQGLHPSIRDVRKSVARELVSLQEKLDHLCLKKSESAHELGSGVKSDEDMQIIDTPNFQGGEGEVKAFLDGSPSGTENIHEVSPEALSQGVASIVTNNASSSSSLEIPEIVRNEEDLGNNSLEPVVDLLIPVDTTGTNETTNETELLPETGTRDDTMNLVCNGGQGQSSEFPPPRVSEEMIHPEVEGAASSVMDEVSNLKQLEELSKGVLDPDSKLQDDDLLLFKAGNDKALQGEVVMENDEHVLELTQFPLGVPEDDFEASRKHVILEQKDDKVVKNEVTMEDITAGVCDGEVLNMDQTEQSQELMVKMPVNSESNESLACHENADNNAELCNKTDFGSHEIPVQALEEEKSFICNLVDVSQMHDEAVSEMDAEVLGCYKNELDSNSTQIEREELTTPTGSIEVSEAEEQVPQELATLVSGTENVSRRENRIGDLKNSSSCEDAIAVGQERVAPRGLTNSWNVETEQKLLDEAMEMEEASGSASGDDKMFAQPSDSASLEEDNVGEMESIPPHANKTTEGELQPSLPNPSQISLWSDASTEHDRKLIEENEKLREMMQKLIEAGKEQLTAISNLSGRVKDLEKKLSRKKKLKVRRHGTTRNTYGLSCLEPTNDPLNEKPVTLAM